ncbi:MAG TPA: hypothetical protein PLP57_06720 [Candidatus Saccharicenans sp.]|jgi:hypothetical protein|nr:hypothetical protein [Candidatus Saccharicenans sp.]HRD02317.1 hypothetical protein [Candidatus Saccharicenans sp.]
MERVIKTVLRAILRPDKNGELLERQLSSGLWTRTCSGLILFGLMFSLTSIIQAFSGNVPAVPLILPLGLENYFVWQAVLFIPWLMVSWLLVSWLARMNFKIAGAKKLSWRQLSAGLALSFYPFLFWLWLPHFFTSVLYLLGMSQKEWVDLLSNPGWFQSVYISLIVIALLSGWLASCLTVTARRWTKRGYSLITGSLSYLAWVLIIFILLR